MTTDHLLEDAGPRSSTRSLSALLVSLVPPAVWFLHLNVSYLLVPPSCRSGDRWPLAAVTLVALVAMVLPLRASARSMRTAATGELDWFLGLLGTALAVLFALATMAVGASPLLVDPCR